MEDKIKELQEALKSKDKVRADLEKSETLLRSEMSRLQAQIMKADADSKKEIQELKRRLAEADNAKASSSKTSAELQEAKKASAAYQKQLQEMHALLEKATSKVRNSVGRGNQSVLLNRSAPLGPDGSHPFSSTPL